MSPRSRVSAVATGVLVAAVYVAAAIASRGGGHDVRPLFDGAGGTLPYQWVNPPAIFKPTNVKPAAGRTTVPIQNGHSFAVTVTTPDQQFLATLLEGAIPPEAGATAVVATVTPLDPATLGAVPSGLVPDGNAYRLQLAYQPSGNAVVRLDKQSPLQLSIPSPATTMLFSADGRTWTKNPVIHLAAGSSSAAMQFSEPGYYLAAGAPGSVPVGVAGTKSSTGKVIVLVVIVIAVAAILGLGPVLVRRIRRPAPSRGRGPAGRRPPPRPRGGQRRTPPPKKRRR